MTPSDLFEYLCSVSGEADPLPFLPGHGTIGSPHAPGDMIPGRLLQCTAEDSPRPFEILPEELRFIRHPYHSYPAPWESGVSL